MPRPTDSAKRRDLLVRVREYMIRNGVAGPSLRLPARGLGTSDRMLLHYFGSKERMVAEAVAVKGHRAVATRFERLAVRYEATVLVAAINEWL
ncbi:hypothetical protein GFH48_00325 [Streptomyces fagopyri]|uniref:TetR family transcriptional regulator n=1 Tax=Streptomyces fagopyri TaxID=2662397 RepID=A0A5Q0L4Q4_9ACTN|nr:hypothetical protein GFH48_00325 [Streptomyces fagopyri]